MNIHKLLYINYLNSRSILDMANPTECRRLDFLLCEVDNDTAFDLRPAPKRDPPLRCVFRNFEMCRPPWV
jgi:hypothetical protein